MDDHSLFYQGLHLNFCHPSRISSRAPWNSRGSALDGSRGDWCWCRDWHGGPWAPLASGFWHAKTWGLAPSEKHGNHRGFICFMVWSLKDLKGLNQIESRVIETKTNKQSKRSFRSYQSENQSLSAARWTCAAVLVARRASRHRRWSALDGTGCGHWGWAWGWQGWGGCRGTRTPSAGGLRNAQTGAAVHIAGWAARDGGWSAVDGCWCWCRGGTGRTGRGISTWAPLARREGHTQAGAAIDLNWTFSRKETFPGPMIPKSESLGKKHTSSEIKSSFNPSAQHQILCKSVA